MKGASYLPLSCGRKGREAGYAGGRWAGHARRVHPPRKSLRSFAPPSLRERGRLHTLFAAPFVKRADERGAKRGMRVEDGRGMPGVGIPRENRFALSRPLRFAKGAVCIPCSLMLAPVS